jgi:DNA-binding transcriptional ArsR family regulator
MNTNSPPPPIDLDQLARLLRILADPTRLQVCRLLIEGKHGNTEIGDFLGIAPNLVSYHLRVLQDAGLIESVKQEQDARRIYYSPKRESIEALNTMFVGFFDPMHIQIEGKSSTGTEHAQSSLYKPPTPDSSGADE